MPRNNTWSLIGAVAATVGVFVLNALLKFFDSGNAWPTTVDGWLRIILPALCAGLAAILVPHYSTSEARTGVRLINSEHDAPVIDKSGRQTLSIVSQKPTSFANPVAPPGPPH